MGDTEESYLEFMRAVTTDAHGNEVLVGLTVEETSFYREHLDRRKNGLHRDSSSRERFLGLHEKHEAARLGVIAAEIQLRDKPTMN